ncbi:hypothetical protein BJ508DRAFT_348126 [Ascobolus immersus RN42]|uniref:Uncharacterized protein n=1 Tax=Ascobolus immersus RN42 TaxID=1160509 RepID=A0A3N4I097_ASCIM|nr:hypothetical protein BJ508DRAFT_348126 [Ascobolus immersus RN42]
MGRNFKFDPFAEKAGLLTLDLLGLYWEEFSQEPFNQECLSGYGATSKLVASDNPTDRLWLVTLSAPRSGSSSMRTMTATEIEILKKCYLLRMYLSSSTKKPTKEERKYIEQIQDSEWATLKFLQTYKNKIPVPKPLAFCEPSEEDHGDVKVTTGDGTKRILAYTLMEVAGDGSQVSVLDEAIFVRLGENDDVGRLNPRLESLLESIAGYQEELLRISTGSEAIRNLGGIPGIGSIMIVGNPEDVSSTDRVEKKLQFFLGPPLALPTANVSLRGGLRDEYYERAVKYKPYTTAEDWIRDRLLRTIKDLDRQLEYIRNSSEPYHKAQYVHILPRIEFARDINRLLDTGMNLSHSPPTTPVFDRTTFRKGDDLCDDPVTVLQPYGRWGDGTLLVRDDDEGKIKVVCVINWYCASFVPFWRIFSTLGFLEGPELKHEHDKDSELRLSELRRLRESVKHSLGEGAEYDEDYICYRLKQEYRKARMRVAYSRLIKTRFPSHFARHNANCEDVVKSDFDIAVSICERSIFGLTTSPAIRDGIDDWLRATPETLANRRMPTVSLDWWMLSWQIMQESPPPSP